MGAAGYVTVYDFDAVEKLYAEMWPDNDLYVDLRYINDPTTHEHGRHQCWPEGDGCRMGQEDRRRSVASLPDGRRLLLDYSDDQGNNEGLASEWFFNTDPGDVMEKGDLWDAPSVEWWVQDPDDPTPGKGHHERDKTKTYGAWARVHLVLAAAWKQEVEVWT